MMDRNNVVDEVSSVVSDAQEMLKRAIATDLLHATAAGWSAIPATVHKALVGIRDRFALPAVVEAEDPGLGGHRVPGVQREIQESLHDLAGIRLDEPVEHLRAGAIARG